MKRGKTADRIGHEAILASAGSGKTFQLAHRYIRLMACGVSPDRICALTFSRKAAGEIFDAVVERLCKAAASDKEAGETAGRIGTAGISRARFLAILRSFLDNLHVTQISTLDSFIVGIIRAFPMELGVGADTEFLDGSGEIAAALRRDVLGRILSDSGAGKRARRGFLESFKMATFGRHEKAVERVLDEMVTSYQAAFRLAPDSGMWGDPARVWQAEPAWADTADADVKKAGRELKAWVAGREWPEKVRGRWTGFIEAACAYDSASEWAAELEYMLGRLGAARAALEAGDAEIKVERTGCRFSRGACGHLLALFARVMHVELDRALKQTRGIGEIMGEYERAYDIMRRAGRMTFDDAQYLLTPGNRLSGGAVISRMRNTEQRLYIDYRLDCSLDHWLLDEFQDTSDLQWEVFRNLADEILQDDSGSRSFFLVGDMKQAIYGWRGGNVRLFGKVLESYPGISRRPLNQSFRSCQALMDVVNRVFGQLPDDLPDAARAEWARVWQEHEAAGSFVPSSGYATLVQPRSAPDEKPTQEDTDSVVVGLVKEIDPVKNGLTVAVLVLKNEAGRAIAELLRRECPGVPVSLEGKSGMRDNPVVEVLLALVQLAAHPGDMFAWRLVQMSPLSGAIAKQKLGREELASQLLSEIQAKGFRQFARKWGRILNKESALDDFGLARLADLAAAAAGFDRGGSRDCAEFLAYVGDRSLRDEAGGAVRVMTVHQAKGLGFDVVILPDLMDRNIAAPTVDSAVLVGRDGQTDEPGWILCPPRKGVAECDPVLSARMRDMTERACYEQLCVLYVAMTRAKRALYMVTRFPGKTSGKFSMAALLKRQLCGTTAPPAGDIREAGGVEIECLFEHGDVHWRGKIKAGKSSAEATALSPAPRAFAGRDSVRPRIERVEPSSADNMPAVGTGVFGADTREVMEFGAAIHELFELVSWADDTDVEAVARAWRAGAVCQEQVADDACDQFRRAMKHPAIRRELTRPDGASELWREQAFDVILGNRWISGKFDRVVIHRDDKGVPVRAVILDYKSKASGGKDISPGYRRQMSLYSEALCRMLGIDGKAVECRLVFTRSGEIVDVEKG